MKTRHLLLVLAILAPWLLSNCIIPGGSAEYQSKLETAMLAGAGPDVGYVDSLKMAQYVSQGWLKPVPEAIDRNGFYPATLEPFMWQGTLYAVPHDTQTVALIVNRDLIDQAGLALPETWDLFYEVAYKLWAPDQGVYGLVMSTGFWSFLPFLYQAGGRLVGDDGLLALNTDQARQALEFYVRPSVEGYALLVTGEGGYEGGAYSALLDAFATGKVAMCVGGPSLYDDVLTKMGLDPLTQTTVEVLELPAGPAGRATIAFTRGLGLFGQPDQEPKPGAVAFLQYATSDEGLAFWLGDSSTPSNYVPVRPSLAEEWRVRHPKAQAFVIGLDYAMSYQPDNVPSVAYQEVYDLASTIFPQVLTGQMGVQEALDKLQTQGNDILIKYRQ